MRNLLTTLAELCGAISITIGAFDIARPAGFIVAGAFAIVGGVRLA